MVNPFPAPSMRSKRRQGTGVTACLPRRAAELYHERQTHRSSLECPDVDLTLPGPGHPGQPILPGVVRSAALSLTPGKTTALSVPHVKIGHPTASPVGQGQATLGQGGEADSHIRFIICVTKSGLIHNLFFPDTDNILGTGDTPLLVLPSLGVNASCCTDDGHQALFHLQSPEPGLLPTLLESRTCTWDLTGAIGTQVHTSVGS